MTRLLVLLLLLVAWLPASAQGSYTVMEEGFFAQHSLLYGLLVGAIGFMLGMFFASRYLKVYYRHRVHQAFLQGREEAPQVQLFKALQPPTNYELMLREENAALKRRLQNLTTPQATSQPGPAPVAAADGAASAHNAFNDAPARLQATLGGKATPKLSEAGLPAAQAAELPITCYAPAQETGFLRDNKLAAEPLPQLPLVLTLCPTVPEKAFFTLNPHVNQAKLIGDGLHRLCEFFDFDLPTGHITTVSADAPGQLARHPDGWRVVSRARLLVS